jgi:hypothetical protein
MSCPQEALLAARQALHSQLVSSKKSRLLKRLSHLLQEDVAAAELEAVVVVGDVEALAQEPAMQLYDQNEKDNS